MRAYDLTLQYFAQISSEEKKHVSSAKATAILLHVYAKT